MFYVKKFLSYTFLSTKTFVNSTENSEQFEYDKLILGNVL